MIPASYLYKDVFRQAFYDPDVGNAIERHHRTHRGRGIFAWLRRQPVDAAPRPAQLCQGTPDCAASF